MVQRILITGGDGQLGQALAHSQTPHQLIVLNQQALDITSADQINQVFAVYQPDLVINAAAFTAVDAAQTQKELAFKVNRDAVQYLAQACQKKAIALCHISTDYVFDGEQDRPWRETDLPNPMNVYGQSKLAGEQVLQHILPQHLIVRVSWLFAKQGHNFVKTMLRLFGEREEVSVVNDQIGRPTGAADLANALLYVADRLLMQTNAASFPYGVYHYSGGEPVSWYAFAAVIEQQMRARHFPILLKKLRAIRADQYPLPAPRPAYGVLDGEKGRQLLGWQEGQWQACLGDLLDECHSN